MNKGLKETHDAARYRLRPVGEYDPNATRFACPATGVAITEATCRQSRKDTPGICANCLIPLAGTHCTKCGRLLPEQEARCGFTTCEFCG